MCDNHENIELHKLGLTLISGDVIIVMDMYGVFPYV